MLYIESSNWEPVVFSLTLFRRQKNVDELPLGLSFIKAVDDSFEIVLSKVRGSGFLRRTACTSADLLLPANSSVIFTQ